MWTYHVTHANHSFRSVDFEAKIIRNCFELTKFSCARTKCESIVTGVFAPYVLEELHKDFANTQFVTVLTDASNHGNIKMFPVAVRYFSEKEGVKIKIIELVSTSDETSDTIAALLNKAIKDFNLKKKINAFCGDNAPCNFGNRERTGTINKNN